MRADDKKIRKAFRELKVPVSYEERVDALLESLDAQTGQEEERTPKRKGKYVFRVAVCLLCVCFMFSITVLHSNADFWEDLKQSLMDFFGFGTEQEAEDAGVDSNPVYVKDKRDLIVELRETVIDSHNIYLLVKITAPPDIAFAENVGFEYFGFCEGENYDVNRLLGGSRDCRLLEVGTQKANEALYVVSMRFDEEIQEDAPVTCFLQNLTADPYGEEPELLVEGIWSLEFPFERTVVESVTVEGGPEMTFPYIDGTAVVEGIELTPTGILLQLDVSDVTYELMNVSDTTVAIKLLYIDGSEKVIVSHSPEEGYTQGGSISFNTQGDKVTQQQNLEFTGILDIGEVVGVYIEELYVPLKQ